MARIISIANQKGGLGKSTIAVGLAAVLHDIGMTSLVVDVDPQRSATDWLSAIDDTPIDWATERDPAILREVGRLPDYNLVLCDTPGSLDAHDVLSAVAQASDFLIVPSEAAGLSVRPTITTIRQLIEPTGTPYKVLLSKVRPQAAAQAHEVRGMYEDADVPVFRNWIRLLTSHEHAASQATMITAMRGPSAEEAANDVRAVALELIATITDLYSENQTDQTQGSPA